MSVNPWDDFARRSRELYEQQTELAKSWLDGQSRLADTLAKAGGKAGSAEAGAGAGQEATAMAELWRSWLALGGSVGAAMPGMADPGKIAGETLGRFLDPMSLALVGGSRWHCWHSAWTLRWRRPQWAELQSRWAAASTTLDAVMGCREWPVGWLSPRVMV